VVTPEGAVVGTGICVTDVVRLGTVVGDDICVTEVDWLETVNGDLVLKTLFDGWAEVIGSTLADAVLIIRFCVPVTTGEVDPTRKFGVIVPNSRRFVVYVGGRL